MYHVRNLASSAREAAEQEQAEFLKRRAFCVRKGFEMYHGPWTVYHVGNLASSARGVAKHKPKRISEATRFWDRKGFEMYHGPF